MCRTWNISLCLHYTYVHWHELFTSSLIVPLIINELSQVPPRYLPRYFNIGLYTILIYSIWPYPIHIPRMGGDWYYWGRLGGITRLVKELFDWTYGRWHACQLSRASNLQCFVEYNPFSGGAISWNSMRCKEVFHFLDKHNIQQTLRSSQSVLFLI